MTNPQRAEAAAKAEDLGNLIDHIAWTDAVKPILMKRREAFSGLLVQIVLAGNDPKTRKPIQKNNLRVRFTELIKSLRFSKRSSRMAKKP